MFGYDGGYVSKDTMVLGTGYWARPEKAVIYNGQQTTWLMVHVRRGWNIIGSLSCPLYAVNIYTAPAGIITSPLFGYKNSQYYEADLIEAGRAYWVKVDQNGQLILSSGGGK